MESRYNDFLYFVLLLTTGARRGEILALQWKDIIEEFSVLVIDETYVEYHDIVSAKSVKGTNTPKNQYSRRKIPIQKEVQRLFRKEKEKAMFVSAQFKRDFSDENYIFTCAQTGEIMHTAYFDYAIQSVRQYLIRNYNLDIGAFTPHYFRHTFASVGLRNGVSLETLKELLGHSDYSMISRIYAHSSKDDKEKAIEAMFTAS